MSFWNVTALRTLLETETDADSPASEELMSQIRENIEALFLLLFKAASGTATSDPPNDSTGYFYDTAANFEDDEHNGRTLLITSGTAKGNIYTIDDTVAASDRVECTGDNLYADGVRSGDSYIILYDLTNTSGHDHDGVNSSRVVLPPEAAGNNDYFSRGRLGGSGTSTSETSWQDLVWVNFPVGGEFRFYTTYQNSVNPFYSYFQILKNGVVEKEWSYNGSSNLNRTDDITVEPGDQLKFQLKVESASTIAAMTTTIRGTNLKGIFTSDA